MKNKLNYYLLRYRVFRNEVICKSTSASLNSHSLNKDISFVINIIQMIIRREFFKYNQFYNANITTYKISEVNISVKLLLFLKYIIASTIRAFRYRLFIYKSDKDNISKTADDKNIIELILDKHRYPAGLVILSTRIVSKDSESNIKLLVNSDENDRMESVVLLPSKNEFKILLELPLIVKSLKLQIKTDSTSIDSICMEFRETNITGAISFLRKKKKSSFSHIFYSLLLRLYPYVSSPKLLKSPYKYWLKKYDKITYDDIYLIKKRLLNIPEWEPIIIIAELGKNRIDDILRMVKSLQDQLYPCWNLLLVANEPGHELSEEIKEISKAEQRVIIKYGNNFRDDTRLSAQEAAGIMIIDYPAYFTIHSLAVITIILNDEKNKKILFTDHDNILENGQRLNPVFKPGWNYEYYLAYDYIVSPVIYEPELFLQLSNATDHNFINNRKLLFNAYELARDSDISHIPLILFHEYINRQYRDIGLIASETNEHLRRINEQAELQPDTTNNFCHIKRTMSDNPLISIIIPTRNKLQLLSTLLEGLWNNTDYSNFEIIIIDNNSDEQETITYLQELQRNEKIKLLNYDDKFNYSLMINKAIAHANSEYVGIINNDITIIHPEWLDEMVCQILRKQVGIVGAKLLYPDGTLQHGGMVTGLKGYVGYPHKHFPSATRGYLHRLEITQEVSCVMGACMLVKKSLYLNVGGMDEENLPVTFNDIDLCLKIRDSGYRIIWTPNAQLYHMESASRDDDLSPDSMERWTSELEYFTNKWGNTLFEDPYFNPNLSLLDENLSLAYPPRVNYPWQTG